MFKYIGKGAALPGIPARDLTEEEAKKYGVRLLLVSKLYVRDKSKPKPVENKLKSSENQQNK